MDKDESLTPEVQEFADRLVENGWSRSDAVQEATRALEDAAIEDGMGE